MTTGSDKSQSAIIQHRLPEFVQANHPTLVAFVQAYYEWLESQKESGYMRTPSALEGISDIDDTLDEFVSDFKKEFLLGFPEEFAVNGESDTVDVRKLIKNIKEFYRNKGTEKTYEFLFRVLYDTAVEFYYPARDILRLSDGKWIQKYSVRCSNTLGNKIFEARGKTITQRNKSTNSIVASGRVIDVVTYQIGNREISELFLTNINGAFVSNTKAGNENYGGIEFTDNDSVQRTEPRIYPVLKSIQVTAAGTGYRKGETISFSASGDSGVGASATITEVDSMGGIVRTRIDNFGIGYENVPSYVIETAFGENASLTISVGSVCTYPGYYSGSDGKLSSSKVMQDNHYYQNFSYVLLSEVVIDRYKEILRRIIHPVGMGMFGKVLLTRCSAETPQTDALGSKTEVPVIGNYAPYTIYTKTDLSQLFYDDRPMPYYPSLHESVILAATGNPAVITNHHAVDFNPKNIPGLKVWLNGKQLTAAGATVSAWSDFSGNGYTATAVATNRLPSISPMGGLHLTGSSGTFGSIITTPELGTMNDRTLFVAFTPFPVSDSVTRQRNSMVAGLQRSAHVGNTGSATGQGYQDHTICIDYLRRNIDSNIETQPRLAAYYGTGNRPSMEVFYGTDGDETQEIPLSGTASVANRKFITTNESSVLYSEFNDLESVTGENINTSIVSSIIAEGYPSNAITVLSDSTEVISADRKSNDDLTTEAKYYRYHKLAEYTIPENGDGSYSFSMDMATDYSPSIVRWKSIITKNDGLSIPANRTLPEVTNSLGEWTWATMSDGITAPLNLDFTTGTLDSRITFSRGSTGSYYRQFNQNLFRHSQDYTQAVWGAFASGTGSPPVITANAAVAPDGTMTANRVVMDRGNGTTTNDRSAVLSNQGLSIVANAPYILSVWMRGTVGGEVVTIRNAAATGVTVTLTTAWQQFSFTANAANSNPSMWLCGNVATTSPLQVMTIEVWGAQLTEGSLLTPYIPTTTAAITQGQIAFASPNTPRFQSNPITGEPLGLLYEGSSTNIVSYSQSMTGGVGNNFLGGSLTGTPITAPDGTQTAFKFIEDTSTGLHRYVTQTPSNSFGTTADSPPYAISVFVKPAERTRITFNDNAQNLGGATVFDLSTGTVISGLGQIQSVGNGWYRCIAYPRANLSRNSSPQVVLVDPSNNTTYTGGGTAGVYVWGFQAEEIPFASAYIPTFGLTATRFQDNAFLTGSNFTSWYDQSGGTIYTEQIVTAYPPSPHNSLSNQSAAYLVQDNNNFVAIGQGVGLGGSTGSATTFYVKTGSDQSFAPVVPLSFTLGDTIRTAGSFYENDFAWAGNGSSASTDSLGSIPTPTSLVFGTGVNRINSLDSRILKKIAYWPTRLPNEVLQNITNASIDSSGRVYVSSKYKTHRFAAKNLKGGDVIRIWSSPSTIAGTKPLNSSLNETKSMKFKNFTVSRVFGQGENILTVDGQKIGSALANLDGITAGQRLVLGLGQNYFNGVVHEVLVYDRALAPRERETVEAYLHYRWKDKIITATGHSWNLPVSGLTNGYGIYPALATNGGITANATTGSSNIGYPFFEINMHPNISLAEQDTYAVRILSSQASDFLGGGTGSTGYWPEWAEGSTANRQNWAIGLSAQGSRHAILQYNTSSEFRKISADAFFDMKAGRQFDCKDEYVIEPEYPKVLLDYSDEFSNSSFEDPIYSNGNIIFHFTTENAENLEYWTTDMLEIVVNDGRGEYLYRPDNVTSKTISGFVSDGFDAKQYTVTVRLLDFYGKAIPGSENSVSFWFKYLNTAGAYDTLP